MKNICLIYLLVLSFAYAGNTFSDEPKFSIGEFNLHLVQNFYFGKYLVERDFSEVVEKELVAYLESAGRYSNKKDSDSIQLNVFVEYYRRFPGDQTPFPRKVLAFPLVTFKFVGVKNGAEVINYQSKQLTNSAGSYFFGDGDNEIIKDYNFASSVALEISKEIAEHTPGFDYKNVDVKGLASRIQGYKIAFEKRNREVAFNAYIPDAEVAEFISGLDHPKPKERIRNYQNIKNQWFNNPVLFEAIEVKIRELYPTAKKGQPLKEVRYALNALASSGDMKYLALFQEIEATEGVVDPILSEIDDSKEILQKRNRQVQIVHDPSTMNATKSWEVNQFSNRLLLNDSRELKETIKVISVKYGDNEYLLDKLEKMLLEEVAESGLKAMHRSDVHAWMCRALGQSKNKKYLTTLQEIKDNASAEKTKKYAKKFHKILSKS